MLIKYANLCVYHLNSVSLTLSRMDRRSFYYLLLQLLNFTVAEQVSTYATLKLIADELPSKISRSTKTNSYTFTYQSTTSTHPGYSPMRLR